MGTITPICQLGRHFTLKEANELLPIIRRIFQKHEQRIQRIMADQRFYMASFAPQDIITECDNKVGQEMAWCGAKCLKLGTKVFGNGYIGFDSGIFYWSWIYDEPTVNHYHDYEINPRARRKVTVLYPMEKI